MVFRPVRTRVMADYDDKVMHMPLILRPAMPWIAVQSGATHAPHRIPGKAI